jgi:hypothetical protein
VTEGMGYRYDTRCGCLFCNECRVGVPCDQCEGSCVVCLGVVEPNDFSGGVVRRRRERAVGEDAGGGRGEQGGTLGGGRQQRSAMREFVDDVFGD